MWNLLLVFPAKGRVVRLFRSFVLVLALLAVCASWQPLEASNRWPDERAAGPFICHADFSLEEHTGLLVEMSRLQRDLNRSLKIQAPTERIHLFLFRRKSTYQKYVKQYFPTVPTRRALFIKERGPGMVFAYRSDDFEEDVRHESTHALLHASLPLVPLWLDEGLAEYFEVVQQERAYGHSHLSSVRWAARFGQSPKIESLEQLRDLSEMGQTQYRHAWAWVHFMLHGPEEAKEELVRYLADIQAHTPPGHLSRRLRARLPRLEVQFREHFRNWKP